MELHITTKYCLKENQFATIFFDKINNSSIAEPDKYTLGIINSCSLVDNICKNCPYIELIDMEVR